MGIGTILEAVPDIVEQLPEFRLLIAGKGEILSEYHNLPDEYSRNIELTNKFVPNEDVGWFFQRSALVVVPHHRHSGTLTIAYSFGKPVIATDIGDFEKLVEKSGAGRVVPPEDPEVLAEAIVERLSDDALRSRMGEASEKMATELSWETIGNKNLEVYNYIF